jgi:hypothetical protein
VLRPPSWKLGAFERELANQFGGSGVVGVGAGVEAEDSHHLGRDLGPVDAELASGGVKKDRGRLNSIGSVAPPRQPVAAA